MKEKGIFKMDNYKKDFKSLNEIKDFLKALPVEARRKQDGYYIWQYKESGEILRIEIIVGKKFGVKLGEPEPGVWPTKARNGSGRAKYIEDADIAVSSFFYYMWNMWCRNECSSIEWTCSASHIWEKWNAACSMGGVWGATERFYKELSDENRYKLVERAVSIYKGRDKICRL